MLLCQPTDTIITKYTLCIEYTDQNQLNQLCNGKLCFCDLFKKKNIKLSSRNFKSTNKRENNDANENVNKTKDGRKAEEKTKTTTKFLCDPTTVDDKSRCVKRYKQTNTHTITSNSNHFTSVRWKEEEVTQ